MARKKTWPETTLSHKGQFNGSSGLSDGVGFGNSRGGPFILLVSSSPSKVLWSLSFVFAMFEVVSCVFCYRCRIQGTCEERRFKNGRILAFCCGFHTIMET